MDSSAITRAAVSAGVFAGIAYAMSGGAAGASDYAMAAGVQAAASLGSDVLHRVWMMYPTTMSSAVTAGGLYTAAQWATRGETNYVSNFGVSAGAEWAARSATSMWEKKTTLAAAAAADSDGLVDEGY